MAKVPRGFVFTATTVTAALGALAAAGCAQREAIVENLPPPNFNGPTIAPQQASKPAPTPIAPSPAPNKSGATASVSVPREWTPAAPVRPWRWIVIHHSATPSGSSRTFDSMHRDKGWDELGYHFVIGNGTDSGDGQVEVGPRWPKQKWGAHAKTPDNRFNDYGIGICLVGNFDMERPTARQTRSLARLVAHLMKTYRIPPERILGHGDTKPTDCPGRNMNIASVRRMAAQLLAEGDVGVDQPELAGSTDLLDAAPVAGPALNP